MLKRQRRSLPPLELRGTRFHWGARTYVMGIINVTPDSFSGDGIDRDAVAAIAKVDQFAAAGCDIIDIGGESTRPGHTPVGDDEELARVLPALNAIRRHTSLPISIDTFKPNVAAQALACGADLINCVWGAIPGIVELAARAHVPLVVMHNRSNTDYGSDCTTEVIRSLDEGARYAIGHGILPEHVIIDPGIGFGKTADHNVEILGRLDEFSAQLPYPLLIGVSRKSFIGKITGLEVGERLLGTASAIALAIAGGADIVRVHDVAAMKPVVEVADAICRFGAVQRVEDSRAPQTSATRP